MMFYILILDTPFRHLSADKSIHFIRNDLSQGCRRKMLGVC